MATRRGACAAATSPPHLDVHAHPNLADHRNALTLTLTFTLTLALTLTLTLALALALALALTLTC